jgi:hypothetical protein
LRSFQPFVKEDSMSLPLQQRLGEGARCIMTIVVVIGLLALVFWLAGGSG